MCICLIWPRKVFAWRPSGAFQLISDARVRACRWGSAEGVFTPHVVRSGVRVEGNAQVHEDEAGPERFLSFLREDTLQWSS